MHKEDVVPLLGLVPREACFEQYPVAGGVRRIKNPLMPLVSDEDDSFPDAHGGAKFSA